MPDFFQSPQIDRARGDMLSLEKSICGQCKCGSTLTADSDKYLPIVHGILACFDTVARAVVTRTEREWVRKIKNSLLHATK